jgi:DNA-binding NarL/FixJ family response regulator
MVPKGTPFPRKIDSIDKRFEHDFELLSKGIPVATSGAPTPAERASANSSDGDSTTIEPICIVVVDDHQLFRTGLAELLEQEGLDIVGTAGDGESALKLVAETAPDVVLMDLDMPGLSGLETMREISRIAPRTRLLVLTVSAEEQSVVDAIAAGAHGYLLKGTSLTSLVGGIKAAVAGESLMSSSIAAKLFARLRTEPDGARNGQAVSNLSQREIEILKLIATGKHNGQIAEELLISPHTVRNHVSNILLKLQMANRIEAAAYAIKNHVV